jgi:hypothetical protein
VHERVREDGRSTRKEGRPVAAETNRIDWTRYEQPDQKGEHTPALPLFQVYSEGVKDEIQDSYAFQTGNLEVLQGVRGYRCADDSSGCCQGEKEALHSSLSKPPFRHLDRRRCAD